MTSATSAGHSRWQAWPAPASTCTEAEGPMVAAMSRADVAAITLTGEEQDR